MTIRGGKRSGAGRKKGSVTRRTQELISRAAEDGETPLEYMLRVMRTSNDDKRKDAMAQAAAPYIHPKLAAVEHSSDKDNPLTFQIMSGVPSVEPTATPVNGKANGHANH